ncbi:MAG TPA: cytochrome c [Myxococcota bacterium]|nr:cytochrome c [Myxococcota bacterium]
MSRVTLLLAAAVLGCAGPKAAVQSSPPTPPESPAQRFLRDPAAIERGRQIFIGTCGAYCHSTHDVERDAPSLFDCEWRHGGTDAEIFKSISEGVANTRMPAWKDALPQGDDDIWRVIAYLRSATTCRTPPASAH